MPDCHICATCGRLRRFGVEVPEFRCGVDDAPVPADGGCIDWISQEAAMAMVDLPRDEDEPACA